MNEPTARRSDPIREIGAEVGRGAVLYDVRDPERRPCCSRVGRCLAHVTGVYEETTTGTVYFEVADGTHTTEEWVHQDDLLALFEPAGWSVVGMKPTYILTREHGVDDHHDLMTDGGEVADTDADPIERVKASDGDLVLEFDSCVGARPYARYANGEWDFMSLTHVPTPDYGADDPDAEHGINTAVHTVDLDPDPDDWSEDELREIAKQRRYPQDDPEGWPGVRVIPVEESPFPDREEIPTRADIVREVDCPACGEEVRQYLPGPFEDCPHCGAALEGEVSADA